jgi:hypothetical protein
MLFTRSASAGILFTRPVLPWLLPHTNQGFCHAASILGGGRGCRGWGCLRLYSADPRACCDVNVIYEMLKRVFIFFYSIDFRNMNSCMPLPQNGSNRGFSFLRESWRCFRLSAGESLCTEIMQYACLSFCPTSVSKNT